MDDPAFSTGLRVVNLQRCTAHSVDLIDAQPIGMATLWEQEDNTPLDLEPVSIAERNEEENVNRKFFSSPSVRASRRFAVLDGRQRCTAIAMAFGGLRTDKPSKFWGRYYLNVEAKDRQNGLCKGMEDKKKVSC